MLTSKFSAIEGKATNARIKMAFAAMIFLFTSFYSPLHANEYRCVEIVEKDLIITSCYLDLDDTVFQHGPYVIRKNNGTLLLVGEFRRGAQDGVWLKFDENGSLVKYIAYEDGANIFESDSFQTMKQQLK